MAITTDFIPDCIFPSDNNMEVPTLRLDRQPEVVEAPFVSFGEQRRNKTSLAKFKLARANKPTRQEEL